jgi:hypothetical protein
VSRGRYIALAAVALVIGGAIFAWKVVPRDSVTRATVGEAVQKFRHRVEQRTAHGTGLLDGVEYGVYRYEIHGGEDVDATILSARHNYGGVSTVAVTPMPCGVEERWQVLKGRWTEVELCRTEGGSRVRKLRDSHEFFGEERVISYACRGDDIPVAADQRPGVGWTFECVADGASATNVSRVVAIEELEVGGQAYDAVHSRSKITLEGEVSGTDRREEWRRRSDGLLLRRVDDIEANLDIIGGASYEEHYSLSLLSSEPER